MKSDIEIALSAELKDIRDIAKQIGAGEDDIDMYGRHMAKLTDGFIDSISGNPDGKLILVTAINPTPAGEGKTTVTIGLGDALSLLGNKTVIALREPSLGPCFGVKGGAAGGGYSQVVPMDKLNLHFTGDFHAITSANNLLCAVLDNHLLQGNELRIDPARIKLKRCLDMNDRALRNIVIGLGKRMDGVTREDHFIITVATEVMAILCLSKDMDDLKERLSRMIVAYNYDNEPIYAKDLNAVGAMAALLKDALRPNLIQTIGGTPAIVHGGPFANIAHGCNSVRATRAALKAGDYVVTEAGFGADLGAEKFMDIKCRMAGISPDAVVLVATVRALKYNGGVPKAELEKENLPALEKGLANLVGHMENLKKFGVPVIVTLNNFYTDTDAEIETVEKCCKDHGCDFTVSKVWEKGGEGGKALAELVLNAVNSGKADFKPLYDDSLLLEEKIEKVCTEIYGAGNIIYSKEALSSIKKISEMGYGGLPVCMAKTQYSFSDDPSLLGRPQGFDMHISDVYISAGAGFVVVLTGDILTMPGLPKHPAAERIDVDESNEITGLF